MHRAVARMVCCPISVMHHGHRRLQVDLCMDQPTIHAVTALRQATRASCPPGWANSLLGNTTVTPHHPSMLHLWATARHLSMLHLWATMRHHTAWVMATWATERHDCRAHQAPAHRAARHLEAWASCNRSYNRSHLMGMVGTCRCLVPLHSLWAMHLGGPTPLRTWVHRTKGWIPLRCLGMDMVECNPKVQLVTICLRPWQGCPHQIGPGLRPRAKPSRPSLCQRIARWRMASETARTSQTLAQNQRLSFLQRDPCLLTGHHMQRAKRAPGHTGNETTFGAQPASSCAEEESCACTCSS